MMKLFLTDDLGTITWEMDEASNPKGILIIAHGAGAGMHHPFLVDLAGAVADHGFHAVRFNFPYMETGRKSPGSPKKNILTWKLIADHLHQSFPDLPIFLSGKSYGGRMASHLLAEEDLAYVKGIIYFGFPLHAPGRDSIERAAHIHTIKVPQLFLQGTKDKLANIDLMHEVLENLSNGTLVELENADHSFNTPKKQGVSRAEMIKKLADLSLDFKKNNV